MGPSSLFPVHTGGREGRRASSFSRCQGYGWTDIHKAETDTRRGAVAGSYATESRIDGVKGAHLSGHSGRPRGDAAASRARDATGVPLRGAHCLGCRFTRTLNHPHGAERCRSAGHGCPTATHPVRARDGAAAAGSDTLFGCRLATQLLTRVRPALRTSSTLVAAPAPSPRVCHLGPACW